MAAGINTGGGRAVAVRADVTREEDIGAMLDAAPGGCPAILVNNAGRAIRRPSVELSAADWNKVVDINMTAVI